MKVNLLEKDPLISMTKLVTGVQLKCIAASEKMARGKHLPGLIVDESCQGDANTDTTFYAAMQMSMSEPEHVIVLLSTFHIPVGLFQQTWDSAPQRGFTRYKWNVFDVMEKCDDGMEFATADDPEALRFCRDSCPLTKKRPVYDDSGTQVGTEYCWCNGKGRHAEGFLPRANIIDAMVLNEGTEIFEIEFVCERPQFSGPIYGLQSIESAVHNDLEIDDNEPTYVGIDWGINEGVLVLAKDSKLKGPQVVESYYLSVKVVSEYIRKLNEWQDEYGHLEVFADSSHPFEISDLEEAGFDVTPVDFSTMKDYGILNLTKMFVYGKIEILDENEKLIGQLKSYRRDPKTGKPVKIDDHGPDALLCATVSIDFVERWGHLIHQAAQAGGVDRLSEIRKQLPQPSPRVTAQPQQDGAVEQNPVDRDNDVMLF